MAQHRYRQNKIKREHTIIDGILPILEGIAVHPHVQGVTPGRIYRRSGNRKAAVTFQYKTEAGIKLLARSGTAVQEVFVVTDRPDEVLADLENRRLVAPADRRNYAPGKPPDSPGSQPDGPQRAPKGPQGPASREGDARKRRRGLLASVQSGERAETGDRTETDPEAQREAAPRTAGGDERGRPATPPAKRPELGDAIDPELQEQLMSLARQGASAETPAPAKQPKRRGNVWRELLKTHRELLTLGEPPEDLD